MSIELARRLLGGGAPPAAVEAALLAEVSNGVPFVEAVARRHPELGPLLERELERADALEVVLVRPVPELLSALPHGLCERLLAVPIRRDLESGRIDVAAADALGPHIAAEFSFHLQAKVRVLRAPLHELRRALRMMAEFPVRMPSDSPIPLIRRPSLPLERADPESLDPVLSLGRAKQAPPPFAFETPLEAALAEIASAESADQISRMICRALEPADAILVAVRSNGFDARIVSRSLEAGDAGNLSLGLGKNSVFDAALRAGFYLGPLTRGLMHSELRSLLPSEACEEVYSAPVMVAGRPALVLLIARFGPSLEATQRADKLLRGAGAAIERVVLAKKRGV